MTALMEVPAPSPSFFPVQHSAWHKPVIYLFGALTALLILFFFAIFILSCTYLKLTDYLETRRYHRRSDLEALAREGNDGGDVKIAKQGHEEKKYLVVMAGQDKPTFLATPVYSRGASSFGSKSTCSNNISETETSEEDSAKKKSEPCACGA